ncbi:MAG: acylphosphatase [Alteromonadaceae bacterium]|nr:acylphosphatase [Alteromonadaceae bacterium]
MAIVTFKAKITGKVQGVFFRAYTKEQAVLLGVKGYANNLADGSVEVLAQGSAESVASLLEWLWTGSPHSQVHSVTTSDIATDEFYRHFTTG